MRVPRGLRHGHGPQAGGVAGEPAVKRRHTPSYGVRFSDARPASGRNPDARLVAVETGPWVISSIK
jgi:hypothetical protein